MDIFKCLPIELQEQIYVYIPDRENFNKVMNEFNDINRDKEINKKIFDKTIFKLQNCAKCWTCELITNKHKFCIYCGARTYAKIFSHFMGRLQ